MKREAEKHLAKATGQVMKRTGHNLNATATRAERSAFITAIMGAWNEAVDIDAKPAKPRKTKAQADNSGLEWGTYPPTVMRQHGRNFHPSKGAAFRFADGLTVRAPLMHHQKRDTPNWARASRMAVHFWRARRAAQIRALSGLETWREAERYIRDCEVPEIVSTYDERRHVAGDADQANLETAELRQGARGYLDDVTDVAAALDGDWQLAAHAALVGYDPVESGFKPGERIAQIAAE